MFNLKRYYKSSNPADRCQFWAIVSFMTTLLAIILVPTVCLVCALLYGKTALNECENPKDLKKTKWSIALCIVDFIFQIVMIMFFVRVGNLIVNDSWIF